MTLGFIFSLCAGILIGLKHYTKKAVKRAEKESEKERLRNFLKDLGYRS